MKRWLNFKTPKELAHRCNVAWRRFLRVKLYRYLSFVICVVIVYKLLFGTSTEIRLPTNVDTSTFPPFEPEVTSDFPPGDGRRIPRIIHQTWADENIPAKFVDNIKSFTKNNPSWEYFLWTDEALTLLIEKHFPNLLPVWNSYAYSYHHRLRRFNAARYVIMYMYGGIFVDMDAVNYRPLDPVIQKYSCILPPEPFEQTYSTYMGFTLTNAIMMCKAKHPFFKMVIDNLHRYAHLSHSWDSAGPGYLTSQYRLYTGMPKHTHQSQGEKHPLAGDSRPYMVRDDFSLADPDAIYVPNSQYFTGNSDINTHNKLRQMCNSFDTLHPSVQRVCVHLSKRGLVRKRSTFTYTEHLWQNNWYGLSNFFIYTNVYILFYGTDIHDIVPHCKIPFIDSTGS